LGALSRRYTFLPENFAGTVRSVKWMFNSRFNKKIAGYLIVQILSALLLSGCSDKRVEIESRRTDTFRIAFGSCNKHDLPQPLWRPIVESRPDLWVWLGDNVYGDTVDMELMRQKYELQKKNSGYQLLLESIPVIGTWDDHDYGKNDIGKEYEKKDESQQLLLNFLGEPADSPRRKQRGVYYSYTYGNGERGVKVLLLDTRYFRDRPGPDGDILGEQQWLWLERELKESTAAVHLICSSTQILPSEYSKEKWADYPKSREHLFNLIRETNARGVIFLSGDIHMGEISRMEDPVLSYPLYEITSSGMTHVREGGPAWPNRYRLGSLLTELNFGIIDIDWNANPVNVKLQIYDKEGRARREQQIDLSQLQPR
jgi:alkaline phosphatase D